MILEVKFRDDPKWSVFFFKLKGIWYVGKSIAERVSALTTKVLENSEIGWRHSQHSVTYSKKTVDNKQSKITKTRYKSFLIPFNYDWYGHFHLKVRSASFHSFKVKCGCDRYLDKIYKILVDIYALKSGFPLANFFIRSDFFRSKTIKRRIGSYFFTPKKVANQWKFTKKSLRKNKFASGKPA